jgi:hypothetical protein
MDVNASKRLGVGSIFVDRLAPRRAQQNLAAVRLLLRRWRVKLSLAMIQL